jgi:hypothetical protein
MTLCTAFTRKESFLLIFSGLAEILFGLPAVVFRRLCLPGNSILNQTGYITFAGLLWIGQGTGAIKWPQTSFMINQIQWTGYGAALAALGLIFIWQAKR